MHNSSRICIDEYKTRDHLVFAVYCDGRQWKRLSSSEGSKPPVWLEANGDRPGSPVSGATLAWLEGVWRNSGTFARVQRFPRLDGSNALVQQVSAKPGGKNRTPGWRARPDGRGNGSAPRERLTAAFTARNKQSASAKGAGRDDQRG